MALIVMKFGGTSVANIEKIRKVADRVQYEQSQGNKCVVILSAMSGVTNTLVGYVDEVSELTTDEKAAEYDVVVSTGEQVTVGLLSLILQERGVKARSYLGWQLPIKTEGKHSKARITEIDDKAILESTNNNEVVIIPGFQGVSAENRITTLGRGGSDTSAVAVAAAINADRCDIYTDVDGVYTTDPRIAPKARRIKKVGYEEMLEMASLGAKVLQTRCVELAMKYNVPLMVRSSMVDDFEFNLEKGGSLLVSEEEVMERRIITGIAYSRNDAQVTLVGVENTPGVAADVLKPLTDAEINVDMIVQNISEGGTHTDMTFTLPKTDLARAKELLGGIKAKNAIFNEEVAKVSAIGVGMQSHAGTAQKMFQTLADKGINIHVISTSEIKISVLIDEEYLELAIRSLHTAYGLDED